MKISEQKKKKISEQILSLLHTYFPKPIFTSHIAREIARDEEFTKSLLITLQEKKLVTSINKNPNGKQYLKRLRWRLSNQAQETIQKNIL